MRWVIKKSKVKKVRNTLSRERKTSNTKVETPNRGNGTLNNFNTVIQESLGENNPENQLTEPTQISNEIQAWTQLLEQRTTIELKR